MAPKTASAFDDSFAEIRSAKRRGAADVAVDTIKSMIVAGKLGAHQRMPSEPDLARMLSVSRPTIREATRALVALNILEARHGDGTYVTSLAPELLAQPIDFLLAVDPDNGAALLESIEELESSLAAVAAQRATEADTEALTAVVGRMSRGLGSPDTAAALDREFHQCLRQAARSPILTTMVSTAGRLAATSRVVPAASAKKRTARTHRAIVAAIGAHDAETARREMARHMHGGCWSLGSD